MIKNALENDPVLKLVFALPGGADVYLVGGVLRNLLLSKPLAPDYDFVLEGDIKGFSEKAAERSGGTPFLLDEETSSYRVVVNGKDLVLDFSSIKCGGITEDLGKRDFTVNALAARLGDIFSGKEGFLIDPCGGKDDAERKILRAVSGRSFDEDPLRCLRAVRISQQYGLEIEASTLALVGEKSALLQMTSAERVRDELFLIFASKGTPEALSILYSTGIIKTVLPEISGWEDIGNYDLLRHSLKTLEEAERLIDDVCRGSFPVYARELKERFEAPNGAARNYIIFKLGAFFHDFGKQYTASREEGRLRFIGHDFEGSGRIKEPLERLKFSKKAIGELSNLIKNHHRVFMLAALKERTYRAKAHLIRASGEAAALDLLCLALADARATRGGEDPELYEIVKEMIGFYFETYLKKKPRPLLSGDEVMRVFKVPEGPLVGEALKAVSDGIERGEIKTKKEARERIRKWLDEKGGK